MSIARKILMGSGGKKDSTYVDDVFSTYLYKGNGGTQTFNNGVDLTKGGLVWINGINVGYYHNLQDNVSGLTGIDKYLTSNADWIANWAANGENDPRYYVTGFNNNGFDIGLGAQVNINNYDFTSWTFRKAKGFCDIVSYTGTGSARTVAHSLGSIPGMILIKRTDGQVDWRVYHQNTRPDTPQETSLRLNTTDAMQNGQVYFNDTSPTSSVFTVGTDSTVNANGGSYVAYIFGGGESNAATAKSVYLDAVSYTHLTLPTKRIV